MSYIKKLIEKYSLSAKRTVASGLVALVFLTGALTACGDITDEMLNTNDIGIVETIGGIQFTESINGQNGNQLETEINQSNTNTTKEEYKYTHSETYNRAKQKWASIWNGNGIEGRNSELGFLTKAAPFKFLSSQGVVYYNGQGEPRAYGTDENFDNVLCIQSQAWIDTNSDENDFYLLTQYISDPIDDNNSNGDAYVATYMLKYTLDDDCYRDLLLLAGDLRGNLLIQQIDQEYTPEVISKSIIRYELIKSLGLFRNLPNKGVSQPKLDYYGEDVSNYVSNIDYNNMSITVNYNSPSNKGDIYSYTYKLKESPYWDKVLVGSDFVPARTEEERDALTSQQIMPTYSSNAGIVLDNVKAFAIELSPSDEQKATSTLKYDFVGVGVEATGSSRKVTNYEAGKISYAEVNSLTRDYINNLKSGITK